MISCEESLPPYQDPTDALTGSVRGRYTYTATENNVKIDIIIVNTFDETFEAEGILEGRATITLQRDQSVVKTVDITPSLWANGDYNPATRVLHMDPGDTLRLMYTWFFDDDSGEDVRDRFLYVKQPSCTLRSISLEEAFFLRANVKVYDKAPEVAAPQALFSICHVDVWIPPQVCLSLDVEEPRSYCP